MSDSSILLLGGTLLDPATTTLTRADLRIRGDRIVEVGRLAPEAFEQVCLVEGLVVAPGFIDTHSHADCAAFLEQQDEALAFANLRQGVTTQVCGNCGYSPFPVEKSAEVMGFLQPALGPGTQTFTSLDEWRSGVASRGTATNLAPLVGHGSLRAAVLGFDDRPASEPELKKMEGLLDNALGSGAFGLSSGLIYAPGMFGGTDELVRLAAVASRYQAPYVSHIRNETDRVREAVSEAVEIGRRAATSVHISHHKAAGRANWGRTVDTLDQIEEAKREGVEVTADVYPYTAGSTALQALLPPWALQGGTDAMLERLRQPEVRRRIADDLGNPEGWQNLVLATGWDGIVIAAAAGHPSYEGKPLATLASLERREPVDLVADLLIEERANVTIVLHMMDEDDVRRVLRWPHTMIGSDGILQPGRPHPRLAGTFARVLGHYCREEGLFALAEAVHRMTSLPARRFGISHRGRLTPGAAADLVVFDPTRVADRATYERPLDPPDGIVYVIVNGAMAIDKGTLTGRLNGKVLRRG